MHITTAKTVSRYFEDEYGQDLFSQHLQLGLHNQVDSRLAHSLTDDKFNIRVVAAILRQLADYRFGSKRVPLKISHSNFSKWEKKDAVALWHGFRYGVPDVSYGGVGFESLEDFQNRCYSLDELVNSVIKGTGAKQSAQGAIRYISKYFN